ncbi:MAG: T9SS type A sorting domain-containing protein [Chitinophagales bacterium]
MRFTLILLLLSLTIMAQETYFNKNYDILEGRQTMKSLEIVGEEYFVLGPSTLTNGEDIYTIWKIDKQGEVKSLYNYGEGDNHDYLEGHLQIVEDKIFVFFSRKDSLSDSKYYLASISLEGELLWEQTYDLGILVEGARKLTPTSDKGFMMAGFSLNFPDELGQAYIVKTDSLGNMEWQKDYGSLEEDAQVNEIIELEEGGYLVMGWMSYQEAVNRNIWVFQIDSEGNMLWEETYGNGHLEECSDILEVEDGYVIVGYQYPNSILESDPNGYIFKIDKEGNMLWEKKYSGTLALNGLQLDDIFREVRELEDGSLVVIGHSRNHKDSGRLSGILMKLTSEGDSLWTKAYSNILRSNHYLWDFEVTEDNGFVMCGWSKGVESETQDGWVLKVDSLGNTCQPANCDSILTTSIQYEVTTHYPTHFYPNPAQNRVTFQHRLPKGKEAVLDVYDLQGREMGNWRLEIGDLEMDLNVEGWESGLYLYRVRIEGREVSSGKLVVEE